MGDKEIYNPWSILNYARRKVLVPYWVNTSANTMLKQAIEKADYNFKKQYEKETYKPIHDDLRDSW